MEEKSQMPDENTFEASVTEATDYIILEPDWENTTLWFSQAMKFHDFEYAAKEPIISFIEQIRYLSLTNPAAVERILTKLRS